MKSSEVTIKIGTGSVSVSRRNLVFYSIILCVFGFLIRYTAAGYTVHSFDMNYYFDWATGLQNGFFDAYEHIDSLDYPPVLLFFLYPIGLFIKPDWGDNSLVIMMHLLKSVQIVTDTLLIPVIYICLKRYSVSWALLMSTLWAINPSAIFDSAFWGQTDSLMMLILLISFTLLDSRRPVAATIIYALACLTKFQCAYFAPVFLLFLLFSRYSVKQIMTGLGLGAALVITVFFPFMLHSGIFLPFRVYFGGLGKYPYATLNAFNLYGLLNMNYVRDDLADGWFTLNTFSMVILVLIVVFVIWLYFKAPNKCPWILCVLIMQCIFIFTTRMHERYEIPVLIFAVAASVKHRDKNLFISYLGLTVMTYINQYLLFTKAVFPYNAPWLKQYDTLLAVFSLLNIVLFVYSSYAGLKVLFTTDKPSPVQTAVS